jgi:hypothetical protein
MAVRTMRALVRAASIMDSTLPALPAPRSNQLVIAGPDISPV